MIRLENENFRTSGTACLNAEINCLTIEFHQIYEEKPKSHNCKQTVLCLLEELDTAVLKIFLKKEKQRLQSCLCHKMTD